MIRKLYANFEEIVGSILLVAICVIATIQVASRYVPFVRKGVAFASGGDPLSWTEEVGTYLFVYLVFVGASLALKKNEHFALDVLVDQLRGKVRVAVGIVVSVLVVAFSVLVLWYGVLLAKSGWVVQTPALEIPRTFPYAAVPFGGGLMLVRSVEDLVGKIRSFRGAGPVEQAESGVGGE